MSEWRGRERERPELHGLDPLQKSLILALNNLEDAVLALTDQVKADELQLAQATQEVQELIEEVFLISGTQPLAAGPAILDAPEEAENALESVIGRTFCRFESQLQTGERRLTNQEQAMRTISRVLQSMCQASCYPGLPWAGAGIPDSPGQDTPAASLAEQAESEASEEEEYPSLHRDGELQSKGSWDHPERCKPCSFFCFSKRGCLKRANCEYCHMLHVSGVKRATPQELPLGAQGGAQNNS